jgi:acyl-CoA synthetase (AMP-forming)/AMP-acid ligase II
VEDEFLAIVGQLDIAGSSRQRSRAWALFALSAIATVAAMLGCVMIGGPAVLFAPALFLAGTAAAARTMPRSDQRLLSLRDRVSGVIGR